MTSLTRFVSCFFFISILVACSNGGSSGSGNGNNGGTTPDTTPNAFSFNAQTDVPLLSMVESNIVTISGINSNATISISGSNGEYSLDGGTTFTTTNGTVANGQQVIVRQTSSDQFSTQTDTTLTVGGVTGTFSVTTLAQDLDPDAFTFTDQTDVPRNDVRTSNSITVTNINDAAPISITGGEYAIDGGTFASTAGTINNGQSVVVRQTSSSNFSTRTDAMLTIGTTSDTFSVTTLVQDVDPDQFTFTDQANVARATLFTSNAITINGINDAAPVSIAGGEYAIDGGTFTATPGTVANGQSIVVRQASSTNFSTTTDATLTVGAISDTFGVTTLAQDVVPDSFTFTDQTDVDLNTAITSNAITVSGINDAASISVSGGLYAIDGGSFVATPGTVNPGQSVTVQQTSSSNFSTTTDAVLTIGGVSDTFSVTTLAQDLNPDQFSFTDQIDIAQSTLVTSNTVTINGINDAAPISISAGGMYSIDAGAFTSVAGTINNGQQVTVQQTSSASLLTTTDVTLTIGSVSDTFSVTTVDDLTAPEATIVFPPQLSTTESATITVRGTASDDLSVISSVMVNGVTATSSDGFATWTADIGLSQGDNTLIVETQDAEGNIDSTAAQADISRNELIINPVAITVDSTTADRALITDQSFDVVYAVDLTTGVRTILSSDSVPNANNGLLEPVDIVVDPVGERALVADTGLLGIVSVRLLDGNREILSDNSTPDAVNPFSNIVEITRDQSNQRLLVVDDGIPAIISVALLDGVRTILSDNSSMGPALRAPSGIVLDAANNRALITDTAAQSVVAVDITTGARTLISDNTTPDTTNPFTTPSKITLDSANNRALVFDSGLQAVIAVDLTMGPTLGSRTILSSASTPNTSDALRNGLDIDFDSTNNRALLVDNLLDSVIAVSGVDGSRTVISASTTPDFNNLLSNPAAIVQDANNQPYVLNTTANNLLALNPNTGARTVISGNSVPNNTNPFVSALGASYDAVNNQILIADSVELRVLAVSLVDGSRTIIADNTSPGTNFTDIRKLAVDSANNRVLVVDRATDAIIAVDLTSGTRTLLSDNTTPNTTNPFGLIRNIAVDAVNNRALVVDSDNDALMAVDLSNGTRTIVSDVSNAGLSLSNPQSVYVDNAQILVTDTNVDAIFSIDPATGDRTVVSSNFLPSDDNAFSFPVAITVINGLLYVVDGGLPAIQVVDPGNGQRVILSK